MKIKLTLEYDGTPFCGFQYQPGLRTIQGEIEQALSVYSAAVAKKAGKTAAPIKVTASGRTDAGVHARGQVVSFDWPDDLSFTDYEFLSAMNGITPPQIAALGVEKKENAFDARRSPHVKCYCYYLLLRRGSMALHHDRAWRVNPLPAIPAMLEAARHFSGTHDFSSFRAVDCPAKTTVRTIHVSQFSRPAADVLVYTIHGTGFLKQMVRTIVGTLVEVGRGNLAPADIPRIIAARDRSAAGATAPACGLVLEWVRYSTPEISMLSTVL